MKVFNLFVHLIWFSFFALYAGDRHAPTHSSLDEHTDSTHAQCYGYAMARAFNRTWNHAVCPAHSFPGNTINPTYFSSQSYNIQAVQATDILTFSGHAVYVRSVVSHHPDYIYVDHKKNPFDPTETTNVKLSLVIAEQGGQQPLLIWRKRARWEITVQNLFGNNDSNGQVKVNNIIQNSPYLLSNLHWETWHSLEAIEEGSVHGGFVQIFRDWQKNNYWQTMPKAISIEIIDDYDEQVTWKARFRNELTLIVTGPTSLNPGQTGTFTANPSGGSGTYTNYRWWERNDEGTMALDESDAPPPGEWIEITSAQGQQTIQRGHDWSFSLKCEVTDSDSHKTEDIHSIFVGEALLLGGVIPGTTPNASLTSVPNQLMLHDNFPNPFNPTTTISFGLPQDQYVKLTIYTISGEEVITLMEGYVEKGFHTVEWNACNKAGQPVSSGVYIYQLRTAGQRIIKKMLLAK